MADLSPAAQAVLEAAFGKWMEIDDIDDDIPGQIAAAALRAAAIYSYCPVDRQRLVTIAAELEGTND